MDKNTITNLKLREPSILDCNDVLELRNELFSTHCKFNGTCDLQLYDDYIKWLANTINETHGTNYNNNPTATKNTYLVVENANTLIGIVEIIFYYSSSLQLNAHVVECIRPSQRRKGYGKLVRKKAVEECNSLGIKKDKISFECNSKACNDTMNKLIDF